MKNVFRKSMSLLLIAAMVLTMTVLPSMAAETSTPPTEVTECDVSGFMPEILSLGFDDTAWMNAITQVAVSAGGSDMAYSKGSIGWGTSDKLWDVGSVTGAYGSYTALKLVNPGAYPATLTISAAGYSDLTVQVSKTVQSGVYVYAAEIIGGSENPDPVGPEKKTVSIDSIKFSTDMFGSDLYMTVGETGYIAVVTGVSVNGSAWEAKSYAPSTGGAYYADASNDRLVFAARDFSASSTTPVLKSGDVITVTADGYEDLTFKLLVDTNGSCSAVEDDGQGDELELHVKIAGSFEAAIVGQKDYDGVSGASTGSSTNHNSAVTVYGALTGKGVEPTDSDWEALDNDTKINLNPSLCKVNIMPDTASGTAADADSGMEGVYWTISSALSLSGTPKDPGTYLISVTVGDNQGRTATSNALPFRVYTGEETLAGQLVLGNLKRYESGLYAWDIMEPWAIKNFGSNVAGEAESVRVPAELEAWFGSHESGLYGYLGYDLAWEKVEAGEIPQTLYIPDGCDLTITNMEILSSVRIVVENGGKLTLSDSTVQGIIDVQKGGTFSMNYDAYQKKFTTGASVCGQIRLADGAILENAAIYSHANYLANGDLTDRTVNTPVVTAAGDVTVKGQVFIQGDEACDNKIGQTGLLVQNGTLTLADGATLVVYGGGATVQLYPTGGTAIVLDNAEITGSGKLAAIGGKAFWGNGGVAIGGTGAVSTEEAFLQGATASESKNAAAGTAISGSVTVTSTRRHVADGTVKGTTADDPLAGLYWTTGVDAVPPLDQFVTEVPHDAERTIGSGDGISWVEYIRYNANYPDGSNQSYVVKYTVKSSRTDRNFVYSNAVNVSYADCGFTVPEGYELQTKYWASKADAANGYRNDKAPGFNFSPSNEDKITDLYAIYDKVAVKNVTLNVAGPSDVTVDDESLTYTVSAQDMRNVATAAVTVELAGDVSEPEVALCNGWYVIIQTYENGKLTLLLGNNAGVTGDGDLFRITVKPTGVGTAKVSLAEAEFASYDGDGESFVQVVFGTASVETVIDYSVYDANRDGVVNLLDITRAQRAYGTSAGDANWNARADGNKDGVVDISDLILIANNYRK